MATIALNYNAKNVRAQKTLEYILAMFFSRRTKSKKNQA